MDLIILSANLYQQIDLNPIKNIEITKEKDNDERIELEIKSLASKDEDENNM